MDKTLAGVCDLLRTEVIAVIDDAQPREEPALRFFFHIRPGPHAGAGHASLAAAHVILDKRPEGDVAFRLSNGETLRLAPWRESGRIAVRFPSMPMKSAASPRRNSPAALGKRPIETMEFGFRL